MIFLSSLYKSLLTQDIYEHNMERKSIKSFLLGNYNTDTDKAKELLEKAKIPYNFAYISPDEGNIPILIHLFNQISGLEEIAWYLNLDL